MSNQALQAEVERLQCLQALGITVYHPRYRLPGAKPSVQGIWPEAADIPAGPARKVEAAQVAGSTRGAAASLSADVAPSGGSVRNATAAARAEPAPPRAEAARTDAARVTPARSAAPAALATPATTAPRLTEAMAPVQNFQLLFLQIDDELAVVNQIPALARPQLQDRQLALLTNLLRWLGKPAPVHTPRMFRWPLPGLEHMAASMSAETSLLHFLEQASTERGFRYLLQLGPQAVAPASAAWQAFATHSLDEMLALPVLKREAWQALLPLHALLHAGS